MRVFKNYYREIAGAAMLDLVMEHPPQLMLVQMFQGVGVKGAEIILKIVLIPMYFQHLDDVKLRTEVVDNQVLLLTS